QRQHAIAFTDGFVEHSPGGRTRCVEQRLIALSPVLPVAAMALINDEVDTAEACRRASCSLAWCGDAPAARRLGLEHAPAVVAGVDAKIGLCEHESNVVASDLLTGAAAEGCVLRHDAFAHPPRQPIAGEEAIERMCRLYLALMIDQLLEVEVRADVAL